ncbi:MAG: hypothetical protein ACLRTD_26055 [Bacteroides sp.]
MAIDTLAIHAATEHTDGWVNKKIAKNGTFFRTLKKVYDAKVIKAEFLIHQIDRFEVFERSWNKYLPFDDFCELILPYRIAMNLEERGWYRERYESILIALSRTDVVEATDRLGLICVRKTSGIC